MSAAVALAARAEPPSEPARFSYGTQQVALLASGGFGLPVHDDRDVDDARMFGLFARWGIGLTDPLARGAVYEGNVELDVQPFLLLNFEPRSGWAAGGSLLLHYNFLRGGAIVPFIEGGGGASELQFDLDDEADGFTFPLEASLGFHVLSFERGALTASVGYFHLSNAGREFPNYGVNAVMVRIGTLFFPGSSAARH
ncbi:MAG: acyloxyacyl hydrolase [Deltaproteobacteria bacterium]|nr:MAG: acyloxyacyl hydrolase [Deltaproteobacteria bacterium]